VQTFGEMSLYRKLCSLREQVANDETINGFRGLTFPQENYRALVLQIKAKLIGNIQPSEAELIHIIAARGTGKSTLLSTLSDNIVKLPRDEIRNGIVINGKKPREVMEIVKNRVHAIVDSANLPAEALVRSCKDTLFVECRHYIKGYKKISLDVWYDLMIELLEENYRVIIDDFGSIRSKTTFDEYQYHYNRLGKPIVDKYQQSEFGKKLEKYKVKTVFLYVWELYRYNQQMYRYLKESRISRLYHNFISSTYVWDYIAPHLSRDADMYFYGSSGDTYKIMESGVIDNNALANYIKKEPEDQLITQFFARKAAVLIGKNDLNSIKLMPP
jgi:hypothetical protein